MPIVTKVLACCSSAAPVDNGGGQPMLMKYDDSIVFYTPLDLYTGAHYLFDAKKKWCWRVTGWDGNSSHVDGYCTTQNLSDDGGDATNGFMSCDEFQSKDITFDSHGDVQQATLEWDSEAFHFGTASGSAVQMFAFPASADPDEGGDSFIQVRLVLLNAVFDPVPSWDFLIFTKKLTFPVTIEQLIDTPYCDMKLLDPDSYNDTTEPLNPDNPARPAPWCFRTSIVRGGIW